MRPFLIIPPCSAAAAVAVAVFVRRSPIGESGREQELHNVAAAAQAGEETPLDEVGWEAEVDAGHEGDGEQGDEGGPDGEVIHGDQWVGACADPADCSLFITRNVNQRLSQHKWIMKKTAKMIGYRGVFVCKASSETRKEPSFFERNNITFWSSRRGKRLTMAPQAPSTPIIETITARRC